MVVGLVEGADKGRYVGAAGQLVCQHAAACKLLTYLVAAVGLYQVLEAAPCLLAHDLGKEEVADSLGLVRRELDIDRLSLGARRAWGSDLLDLFIKDVAGML